MPIANDKTNFANADLVAQRRQVRPSPRFLREPIRSMSNRASSPSSSSSSHFRRRSRISTIAISVLRLTALFQRCRRWSARTCRRPRSRSWDKARLPQMTLNEIDAAKVAGRRQGDHDVRCASAIFRLRARLSSLIRWER